MAAFKTIEFAERKRIAELWSAGAKVKDIADKIGVTPNSVYSELKRGQDGKTLDKNFRLAYDPELAEKRSQEANRRRGRRKEETP